MIQGIFETVFDIIYLSTVVFIGFKMIRKSKDNTQYLLFGFMAITLGFGDAFHLIPRSIALTTTGLQDYTTALGIGKLITSITMTFFYVLLYYVWRARYSISDKLKYTVIVWFLAISRIIICFMPQNKWTSTTPPLYWGIFRNIPFALLGLLIIFIFYFETKKRADKEFRFLWLTIVLSFAFYIPVVLFSHTTPIIGALMIPKTCAYVWTVFIGYNAMKREAL